MTHQNPRPAEVIGGIVAAGLTALADHMHTHHLPAPQEISVDTEGRVTTLTVTVSSLARDPWLHSAVGVTLLERRSHPSGWVFSVYDLALACGTRLRLDAVHLPDDLRVTIPDTPAALFQINGQRKPGEQS